MTKQDQVEVAFEDLVIALFDGFEAPPFFRASIKAVVLNFRRTEKVCLDEVMYWHRHVMHREALAPVWHIGRDGRPELEACK